MTPLSANGRSLLKRAIPMPCSIWAQAYRLGRGVRRDEAAAENLYRRAAEAGHMRSADTYGLMLFQSGRHEEAMPYIMPAASRGDPRAQYLLGVAHFNGQLVDRDWERAYALLTWPMTRACLRRRAASCAWTSIFRSHSGSAASHLPARWATRPSECALRNWLHSIWA